MSFSYQLPPSVARHDDDETDSSLHPIDADFDSQTDSSRQAMRDQLTSEELLRRFHEGTSSGNNSQKGQQKAGPSPTFSLPRLGADRDSPSSPGHCATTPQGSPAMPLGAAKDSPGLRPRFIDISSAKYIESLTSDTVVFLTGKHGAGGGGGSNPSSVLPTPSGAHSRKTKVFVYDGDALEEHRLAREWLAHARRCEGHDVTLPVSRRASRVPTTLSSTEQPHAAEGTTTKDDDDDNDDDDESSTTCSSSSSLSQEMYGKHPSSRLASLGAATHH